MKTEDSFRHRYCESRGLTPERFRGDLLARTLYPPARPLVPLLRLADPEYFQPDLEFIDAVGLMTDLEGFHEALDDYVGHYANRRFLRHRLRLRISARRMWRIARQVLPGPASAGLEQRMRAADSVTPFDRHPPQPRG